MTPPFIFYTQKKRNYYSHQSQPSPASVARTSSDFLRSPVSGLLGLGFETIAQSRETPFWQALAQDGHLTTPEMSFWFTRFVDDPNAQTLEPGGIFTLGGTNSSLFVGDIDFVDIPTGVNPSFWLLPLMSGWIVVFWF